MGRHTPSGEKNNEREGADQMTTKDYLKKYRDIKRIVKYCDRKIAEGNTSDDLMLAYECHSELVANIEHAVAQLTDPTEQILLRLRYFEGYSWTKVGFIMHYSKSSLQRIHAQALAHLEQSGGVVIE